MEIELVTWDIQDTLIPNSIICSEVGKRVLRSNCIELSKQQPLLPLIKGVEDFMKKCKERGAYQGIISSASYQYAMNCLTSSPAIDYIDFSLLFLAHKFAWEGFILDNACYDKVLREFLKPAPFLYNLARKKISDRLKKEINPNQCIHIGNNEDDEQGAKNAGWRFCDVKNLESLII